MRATKKSNRAATGRLSDRVRRARRVGDITQAELARRLNVRPSAVAQWEAHDGTLPTVDNLINLSVVTGVSFEWLATGRGPTRLSDDTPAADISTFAQDLEEERMLLAFRRLPYARRAALVHFLETLLSP